MLEETNRYGIVPWRTKVRFEDRGLGSKSYRGEVVRILAYEDDYAIVHSAKGGDFRVQKSELE